MSVGWSCACAQVDAEAAAAQAQAAALRRVGQGGLNEAAGEHGAAAAAADGSSRRQDTAVSETQVVRHPSEVERVLRLLQQQISRQGLSRCGGWWLRRACRLFSKCAILGLLW